MDLDTAAHLLTKTIHEQAHQWEHSAIHTPELTQALINAADILPYTIPFEGLHTLFTGWTAALITEEQNAAYERRIPWGHPRLEALAENALDHYEEDLLNVLHDAGYPGDIRGRLTTARWLTPTRRPA